MAALLAFARVVAQRRGPGSGNESTELNSSIGALAERGERLEMVSGVLRDDDDVVVTSIAPGVEGITEETESSDENVPASGPPGPGDVGDDLPPSSIFIPSVRRNPATAAFYDEHSIDASAIQPGDGPFRDDGASVQQLLSGGEEGPQVRPVNISELNMVSRSRGRTLSAGVRTLHLE
jgi:hypothetical protein